MTYANQILKMAHANNGVVTNTQVTKAGISREYLRGLVGAGLLERSDRGVYIVPTVFNDEMFNLQTRFKRGIFSQDTALFLLDLTDRTPIKFSMTFPLGYNTGGLRSENVKCYRVKDAVYALGVIDIKSPGGNPIRCYNAERTLCDILQSRSNSDIQVVTDAFKRYARLDQRDIPMLSKFAKLFRVEKKLRAYLEILL